MVLQQSRQYYKLIPESFKNPVLLMGGAGKTGTFANVLMNERISGVVNKIYLIFF